jgi:hypothetical protein
MNWLIRMWRKSRAEVRELRFGTRDPYFAGALFVKLIAETPCDCGGKWAHESGELYRCDRCGTYKIFRCMLG